MKRVILAAVVAALSFVGFAKTIDVPLGEDVAAAVAGAEAGDVVQLAAGEYTLSATVTIAKGITVKGAGRSLTTVNGGKACQLFVLSNADAVLSDLTITGGKTSSGGGVKITAGTLQDAMVENCEATTSGNAGGGIWLEGSQSAVRRCEIRDNTTPGYGGGIYVNGSSVVEGCLLTGNGAKWGSGIYVDQNSSAKIVQTSAYGNVFTNGGEESNGRDVYNWKANGTKYLNCYAANGIKVNGSPTKSGCVENVFVASEDDLVGKGVDLSGEAGLDGLDINSHVFNFGSAEVLPSAGCVEYNPQCNIRTDELEVAGYPEDFGSVTPAYGLTNGLSAAEQFVCSAPSVGVDLGDGRSASCIGYTLYTNKLGTLDEWLPWTEGAETSFTYAHPAYARAKLVWNWSVKAPIGMDRTLTLASSAFGSSVVAANVTGIGLTASSATLAFHYGTAQDDLSGTITVSDIVEAGTYGVQIPTPTVGQTYYVQATLSNGTDPAVSSDVLEFTRAEAVDQDVMDGYAVHSASRVPSDYEELPYIIADGGYVDTPICPDTDTRVTATVRTEYTSDKMIYGVRNNGLGWIYWVGPSCGNLYSLVFNNYTSGGTTMSDVAEKSVFSIDVSKNGLFVNGVERISAATLKPQATGAKSTRPMMLFALRDGASIDNQGRHFEGECYGFTVYTNNGVKAIDYVPARERADGGRVGFWDTVNNAFVVSDVANKPFKPGTGEVPALAGTHTLFVRGTPNEERVVAPAFGEHRYVSPGEALRFATFAEVETNGETYVCAGYEVYTIAEGGAKTLVKSGPDTSFELEMPDADTEVLWKWSVSAPIGVNPQLAKVSSAFGSSVVAATVTGIGETASEATLVFAYGTASDALDHTLPARVIDNAGTYEVTIPHLIAGTHCYVQATLSNDVNEVVVSDVIDFVQPEVAEPGDISSASYHKNGLVGQWDGIDNVIVNGVRTHSDAPDKWYDLSGNGFDGTFASPSTLTWDDDGWRNNAKTTVPVTVPAAFSARIANKVYTIEFLVEPSQDKVRFNYFSQWNNTKGFGLEQNVYGQLRVGYFQGLPLQQDWNSGTPSIPKDEVTHVAVTASNGVHVVYLNGVKAWTATGNANLATGSDIPVAIGGEIANRTDMAFLGKWYACRAYDRALSAAEVAANYAVDVKRYVTGESGLLPLELRNGELVATVPASGAERTATLYWGETYGGVDDWAHWSEGGVTIPAGATTVSFPKPAGWGSSVWFARVRVGEGDDALWSKTMMPEQAAPLGMNQTLSLVSSAFGSSDIAATVTGIGLTATSATLTFRYGTASNALDGTVEVPVTDAGVWSATIPRLRAGTTYYVKATLSNSQGEGPVESDVFDFVQPEVAEPGIPPGGRADLPAGFAQMKKLVTTGTEYIVTEIVPPSGAMSAEAEFGEVTFVNSSMIFGQESYAGYRYMFGMTDWAGSGEVFAFWGDGTTMKTAPNRMPTDTGCDYSVAITPTSGNKGTITVVNKTLGTSATITESLVTGVQKLQIFRSGDQTHNSKCALYSARFWSGSTLLGDFVPAYEPATGKVGLYDFVTQALYESAATAFARQDFVCTPLVLANGELVLTIPASDADRTATLCWGETYGGVGTWEHESEDSVAIPAYATTVSFPKPDGWGKTVWFVRAKIGAGDDALWSKTMMAEPPAPLGVNRTLTLASSAFGSSDIAATVTGIGTTASSATLTFHYGSTPDCADGAVTVADVTDAGEWSATIPHLAAGKTYYVKATLENDDGESVVSDVLPVVQPELVEEGGDPRIRPLPKGYVQMEKLVGKGNEYIQTDFLPDNTTATEFEFGEVTYVNQTAFFGQGWAGSRYLFNMQSANFYFHGGGALSPMMKVESGYDYSMKIEPTTGGNGTLTLIKKSNPEASISPTVSLSCDGSQKLAIFASNGGGNKSRYSLYSLKFWKAGELAADYVPAYEAETGTAGLYDLKGRKFYSSKDTAFERQSFVEDAVLTCRGDKLVMTVPAPVAADTAVSLFAGETYGGVDGWGAAVETGTLAAGATTVEFDLPTGWGKTVWFARAKIGEGDDAHWSKTLVAADVDVPSVTLDSLSGVGGDTMVVKGTVESLGGTSCTLTAYVGPDENSLTNVWANVDGSILTETGDFTLKLFEDDTTAPRYLVPGETNFVRVVATSANGKVAWSGVKSVTMAKEAAFKSQSAAFSKRMMTVTAQMSDLGMTGKTMVELWVGADAGSLAKVAGPVAVTNISENFTLSYELPHYETPYFWQLKAVNTSEGGTDRTTVESETTSQTAQDTATYTWTGASSDNKWSNSGNWSSSAADCIGYPASAGATATINMKATIDVDVKTTLKTLTLSGSWLDLTLRAENATDYGITASMGTPPAASHITLDGVSVAKTGGGQWNMPANSTFELKNGAVFTSNDGFYPGNAANVKLLLSGCSSMTVAWLYTGVDSYIELDDSSLTVNSYTFNLGYVVGDTVIRFKGKAPCLTSAVQFYIYNASAHALFDFVVPVGGYDAAPVVANGGFNTSGKGPVQVRISDESPAARVDETLESVPLVQGSIGKANVETVGLADTSLTSDFIWGDESATPKALSVKIAGSTHEHGLTVAGVPEEVLGDRISPTYGHHDDGEPKTLTAPEEAVYFADDTRRATCLGWKLYDMDSATHEATLNDSGTGNSYGDWTSPGHWQKFEWQWKVESKVVASAGEGGTAAVSSEWVTEGETVTITATPGEGRSFYRWTRNGSGETFSRDAVLTLPVTEPSVFTAEFAGIVHVAAKDGHDDTGDGSSANPFATLQKALTVAEPGDEIRLQDGEYHMDDPFTLIETNVTVRSANGPDGCLLMPATNSANAYARGIIQVLHADAVVDGLTLRGGNFYGGYKPYSPIIVTAGLVRNCIIRNNAGGTSGGGNHGGVTMEGGVIRDCVLFSNYSRYNNGGTGVGGALYLTAGLVENCVITNNGAGGGGGGVYLTGANSVLRRCYLGNNHGEATTTGWRNAGSGGGVSVGAGALVELCTICGNLANNGAGAYLAGGTIRNSLIVGNHGLNAGAGVYNNGGTVVNCTIADNDSSGTTSGTGLRQTLGSTVNTVIYGNPCGAEGDTLVEGGAFAHNFTTLEIPGAEPEDGNVFGNVFYRDAENDDYRLSVGSKAVDAATPVEGVVTDLSGVARPQGAAPDIGCYECVSGEGGLTCVFNPPDKTIFLDEGEATFTASADGADTEGLVFSWYFDGVLQADQTGSTSLWSAMGLGAHTVKVVVRNAAGEEAACELKDVVKVTTTHVFANENGSNTYPYDTPEKGAPQLQDALDAVWVPETGTATVTVCPGTYECLSRWFIIKQPIVIESSEGPENTILKAGAPSAGARRVVNLNHPGAVLRGLTLTGGNWDGTLGDSGPGALRLEAGTVTNCIIRNNRGCYRGGGVQMSGGLLTDCEICTNSCIYNNGGTDTRGGGVYMTGGTVVGCRVHDCYACTGGDTGGGIWTSGGVVRDCEIYANYSGTAYAHGIGVCVSGTALVENCAITNNPRAGQAVNNAAGVYMTGGTVRNCLVAGNTAVESGAGVWQSGGTLEFCTVAGNVSQNRAGSGVRLDGAAAVCRYNVISANGAGVEAEPTCNIAFLQAADFSRNVVQPATAGTDNIGEAPGFVDAAAGDWTLGAGSPAIDAAVGLDEDYLAYDLVGNRRPKDGDGDGTAACDLGCYEAADASEGPLSCSFSPAESRGIDEVTVTFEASAIGQGSTGELHYDWDFGGGVLVGDSSDVPNPTVRYGSFGSFDVSLTVTAAGGAQAEKTIEGCVKVGTDKIFVVQENENARWPYATWETAATNLNEAFNSMIMAEDRPPTITLSNGTYRVGQKAFVLGFPIRITSAEGPEKTIVQAYYPEGNVYLGWRLGVFWVEHPEAMVDGVTMTGAKWGSGEGGASALRLSAGVVSNCVIRDSSSIANGYGAVQVSGTGRLTHSAIINCSGSWGSSAGASIHGAGLTLDGDGLVEWTVISNCATSTAGVSSSGGGVYMKGGTLRDSSVLDCATFNNWDGSAIWQTGGLCERCVFGDSAHENGYGAAVYLTGGTNRNNVIRRAWTSQGAVQALRMSGGRFWNNTVVTNGWASTQESPVAASVTGGEVKNCIFACNKGADVDDAGERVSFSRFAEATDARGNTAADPRFRNLDKPVWTLSGSSPCANRGDMSIWAEESAPVDFFRKPRIKNRRVDMGACECQAGGTVIIVR